MLGLGERKEEVLESIQALAHNGCDVLTLGQYLQPSQKHLPVARFVHPDEFAELRDAAYKMGFDYVESGPLVRSSYHSDKHVIAGKGRSIWEGEQAL
jgi:lipoic acid synthetase